MPRGEGKSDDEDSSNNSATTSPIKKKTNKQSNPKPTRNTRATTGTSSKQSSSYLNSDEDNEIKRAMRWISFTKPKITFGFETIPSNQLPITSPASRGLSLCFDRIHGWNIPSKIINEVINTNHSNKYEITLQLSLSLFHFSSSTFFGSTWMGSPQIYNTTDINPVNNSIDIDYTEIIYLITRIVDPTCIGVIELVCSKVDTTKNIITSQYGCGYSLINLFQQPFPIDISEGPDNHLSTSIPIYYGSPRDLILDNDIKNLPTKLKEIPGSKLYFRLYSNRKLLTASRLIAENQLIGRYDSIAGLLSKEITLPDTTRTSEINCIGEDIYNIGKRGTVHTPSKPLIALPLVINIQDCYLYIPDRIAMETRLRTVLLRTMNSVPLTEIRIVARNLKIGLHNGHTIISNEWHTYTLVEDSEDPNNLLANNKNIELNGYVPNENMAIVILLEYEVGVPSSITNHLDTISLVNTNVNNNITRPTTYLALTSAIYIPYNGSELILKNIPEKEKDLLNIELNMSNDTCSLLTLSPVYIDENMTQISNNNTKTKSNKSLMNEDSKSISSEDTITTDIEQYIVSFDLRVYHPKQGELLHRDTVYPESITSDTHKLNSTSTPTKGKDTIDSPNRDKKSTLKKPVYAVDSSPSDENESLVGGTSEDNVLRLDPSYYDDKSAIKRQSSGIVISPRMNVPRDKNSLLSRALLSKVNSTPYQSNNELLDDHEDKGLLRLSKVSTKERYYKEGQARDMSRGAKTRLSRYGFNDAFTAGEAASSTQVQIQDKKGHIIHADLNIELNDPLTMNEITITFAGYRTTSTTTNSNLIAPKSIYLTYQFYTCNVTRTEIMKLSPSENGSISILLREDSISRNEATLSIRHNIDTSLSTPNEINEFVNYLTKKSLFIDIWDANSLILIGTTSIPLYRLLRQGESHMKSSLECDIINSEISVDYMNTIASDVIYDNKCMSGILVGSLEIILMNNGFKGKGIQVKQLANSDRDISQDIITKQQQLRGESVDPLQGLNWRSHGISKHNNISSNSRRPKNIVRARPLSESTPELATVLTSFKNDHFKSLTSLRGDEGFHSLTYDEVVMLFKRFQGNLKGTIQYRGPLLTLLDVPTWNATYRKLMDAYQQLIHDGINVEKELTRHIDGDGKISSADLKEFLYRLFDRTNIKYKPEEVMIIIKKFIKDDGVTMYPSELINYCTDELNRIEWKSISKKLIRSYEKCMLDGINIEYLLSEKDSTNTNYINTKDFKQILNVLNDKLSSRDIDIIIKYFSERNTTTNNSISIKKFMSFFGQDYNGNIITQVSTYLQSNNILTQLINSTHNQGLLTINQWEDVFKEYNIYNNFNTSQIKYLLQRADSNNDGKLTIKELLSYLNIPYSPPSKTTPDTATTSKLTAEELLHILIDRSKSKGSNLSETFRHFDIDGDGYITTTELELGLDKLGIFDNIPSWKTELPSIINKIDTDHEGLISLRALYIYLNIEVEYTPNILQKITKIFAIAIEKGMSFETIFNQIDSNNNGLITSDELFTILQSLGTFKDVHIEDIEQLFFDMNNNTTSTTTSAQNKSISLVEFKSYFNQRVNDAIKQHKLKKADRIISKFNNYMIRVVDKGGRLEDIFQYFDTSSTGVVERNDIFSGMQKISSLKELKDDEINILIDHLITNDKDSLSLAEFKQYYKQYNSKLTNKSIVKPSIDEIKIDTKKESKDELKSEGKSESKEEEKVDHKLKDSDTYKELFIRHMRRIASIDGSLAKLLGYLDDDEDGLIEESDLLRLLRKEDVFDTVPLVEIEKLLIPMLHHNKIDISTLLRYLEGKNEKENNHNHKDLFSEEKESELSLINEYDFSKDAETRSLEKKLRSFGNILANRGTDVEKLFTEYDPLEKGLIRRTDFINILSKMGLYILEKGKVIDDATASESSDPDRRLQLKQIKKLKGNFIDNAERFAHKFVMEGVPGGKDSDFRDHLESMALINWYRQGQKKMLLQRVLSHSLSASIRLYPRFGTTLFFEHPVTNPFAHEERFCIELNDSELKVVTNFNEWIQLRRECLSCAGELGPEPIETEMFDHSANGSLMVALLPHETLHIPFTFLSQKPLSLPRSNNNLIKKISFKNESKSESKEDSKSDHRDSINQTDNPNNNELPSRNIDIKVLSCTHGHVCSVLRIAIFPRPFILHRTLRYFEPENSIMKRKIKLAENSFSTLSRKNNSFPTLTKFIHCVENIDKDEPGRVMIDWGEGSNSASMELLLRYRCGSFPESGSFYLLIYNDPFQCTLYEMWQVIIQTRQTIHVHASIGSISNTDFIVRGDKYSRRGHVYSSRVNDTIQFIPDNTFQLVPNIFNKFTMKYSPKQAGLRRVQVNLVDVDSRELVSSWLVTVSAAPPSIMRQYDVDVQRGVDVNKKIVFKNPWSSARRFFLSSSDELVMKPKTEHLEVASQGNSYLRLWFSGSGSNDYGTIDCEDVYLFLNNEDGQNEESFQFKVSYR